MAGETLVSLTSCWLFQNSREKHLITVFISLRHHPPQQLLIAKSGELTQVQIHVFLLRKEPVHPENTFRPEHMVPIKQDKLKEFNSNSSIQEQSRMNNVKCVVKERQS
ncbi:hypothetical protein CsSME_00004098 [Camellia sinensis var. sinensis]